MNKRKITQALEHVAWQVPHCTPGFLSSEVYTLIQSAMQRRFKGIPAMRCITKEKGVPDAIGSNVFVTACMDTELRKYGAHVATLAEANSPAVLNMIKDKHCIDIPAFVVQSAQDSLAQNRSILEQVIALAEQKTRSVRFPFMVTGFTVAPFPEDREGYGLRIVPRDDCRITYDKRLSGTNSGKRFTQVDMHGIPLFDENGTRTFYARTEGIAGLCFNWDRYVIAKVGNLAYFDGNGRVVLVRDEVAGAKK